MSDQEMQFADPDWKPTRPLDKNKAQQEQEVYTPQPINVEPQEQQNWQSSVPLPDYDEGYSGSASQVPPAEKIGYSGANAYRDAGPHGASPGQFKQPQARRRGRSSWFWIIIALIILGLMSGGFGSAFREKNLPFDGGGFGFPQKSVTDTRNFAVGNQPTIVINDASGDIQVHTGDTSGVTVHATKQAGGFGNPNNEQVSYLPSPDGNTITINTGDSGSVNFDVTVPSTSNLNLKTNSGNIEVDGINGQISMSTGSGGITAKQDQLAGSAVLHTDSGDITFDGGITGSGDYQFTTGSGEIDANLNSSTALNVNASTDNGSITSNVQSVPVQNNDSGGTANGYIGSPNNSTKLTLKTGDGSINLNSTP